jgi:hypothetical protein
LNYIVKEVIPMYMVERIPQTMLIIRTSLEMFSSSLILKILFKVIDIISSSSQFAEMKTAMLAYQYALYSYSILILFV